MEDEKKPKKRGRKPKKKGPEKKETEMVIQENLIIKLNHSEKYEDPVVAYEEKSFQDCSGSEYKCGSLCWNCSHPFYESIIGIPLKYENEIFYTYGDFCSLECGARYASEYFSDKFLDIYSLINLFSFKIRNIDKPVVMAPNKLLLTSFGGNLTIDDYRKDFMTNNVYNVIHPLIVPLRHITDTYEVLNNIQKNNYKLYRKSALPTEKKSITDSMNLIINNS